MEVGRTASKLWRTYARTRSRIALDKAKVIRLRRALLLLRSTTVLPLRDISISGHRKHRWAAAQVPAAIFIARR